MAYNRKMKVENIDRRVNLHKYPVWVLSFIQWALDKVSSGRNTQIQIDLADAIQTKNLKNRDK